MASGYRLGVDLGTTYTAAAIERDRRVEVCTLGDRTATIPSLALLRPSGEIVVGEAAERRAASEPTAIAREFKRRLGDPAPLVLGGVAVQPEALMAAVLRHVVNIVTTREDRAPERVVLSHPANFGPYKTGLMRTVAELADLGANVELVAEPQAAAISYAQRSVIEPGKVVAVYDFGGGTFDAALVRRTATGGFDIVGQPEGLERLGGIDLDQLLVEHVLERAGATAVLDAEVDEATLAALVELRDRCQAAKEALSADSDARIAVNLGGVSTAVRVTRDEFADLVRPRVMETVEALQRAIRNSGLSTGDIDRVLLVGGSSRIPLVADTIRATLHRPVALDANPKTAICEGAALYLATAPPSAPGVAALGAAAAPSADPTSTSPTSRGFAAPTIAGAAVLGAAAAGAAAAAAPGPPSPSSVPPVGGSTPNGASTPPAGGPPSAGSDPPPLGPPPGAGPPPGSGPPAGTSPPPGSPSFVTPPPGAPPGGAPPGAAGDPPERGRRKVVLIGAIAAVVVALIVALVILVAGGDDKQTATTDPTSARATSTSDETSPTPPVTTEAAPTEPTATTDAPTDPPPPTDATTTTLATSVAPVGKTVYFAGFQIDVASATFAPPPSEFEHGKLVLDSVATNLVDRSANIGFITNTAPITLVADGFSFPLSLTLADIPPGGKAKFTMTNNDLDTFAAATSEVDFGGPQFNGAVMPLGAGDVTTTAPRTVALSGSTTSPNQLTVTLTQGLIEPFSPMANGGGDVTPSAVGQLFIGITAHLTFSGDFDDGVFDPVLQRPDGSTDSVYDSKTSLVNPGGQADDLYVFKIPAQSAGDYVLSFGTGRGGSVKNEIPFTLA